MHDIAQLLEVEAALPYPHQAIRTLVTDTRTISNPEGALFFAIQARRNGHAFISQAYAQGIRNFVISEAEIANTYRDANFIFVTSPLAALQQLAAAHRRQSALKVIGITGSNGKTIVKEWLNQVLAADFNIVRSPKSFNSQIGLALSLWEINTHHNLGIFEAGISEKGEMSSLAQMMQPDIGILTNIGEAHAEGFRDKAEKLQEKLQLFKDVALFIYAPEYVQDGAIERLPGKCRFSWSRQFPADLRVSDIEVQEGGSRIKAIYQQKAIQIQIPFSDKASVENAIICWATLLALDYTPDEAAARLSRITAVSMRLVLVKGINNCSLIDDSYSADISSLAIALDFLNLQQQHPKKTVILSDLYETGKTDEALYAEIAMLLRQKKINRLIGIGPGMVAHAALFRPDAGLPLDAGLPPDSRLPLDVGFPPDVGLPPDAGFQPLDARFFESTEAFIHAFESIPFNQETILVKGARRFQFSKISRLLTQKTHDTVLEINLNALVANLQYYRAQLSSGTKIMAMVKAFSYGSGSFEIANLLQHQKVDYLAVAYADEGIALRQAGISLPIMVMSPQASALDALINYQLEPEIYSLDILQDFIQGLPAGETSYAIHLKVDTGMHRLGFESADLPALKAMLAAHPSLHVASVFTHLVASEAAAHDDFTRQQLESFSLFYTVLTEDMAEKPLRHVLNTSGLSRWPQAGMDMVRLGIGLYGFDAALRAGTLQAVATLKTTVTQVKHLAPGETVGYGRKGILPQGGEIATVKIGYADGYSRRFGEGRGHMLVKGQLVPTIGSICMDMCMLDVSGMQVQAGDEVIVFNAQLPIEELARQANTIPYEILTNVSQRVKRIYYYE